MSRSQFPVAIPLGMSRRPAAEFDILPAEVRGPEDLPCRFLIGSIAPESFQRTGEGWTVLYVDPTPDTWCRIEFSPSNGRLSMSLCWRGIPISGAAYRNHWRVLLEGISMARTEEWDREAGRRIPATWNAGYLVSDQTMPEGYSLPDGGMKLIRCPVPIGRLRDAARAFHAIGTDPRVASPTIGTLHFTRTRLRVVPGRCDPRLGTPAGLADACLAGLGPPPVNIGERRAGDGSLVLEADREHYVLLLVTYFRDMERILGHLAAHQLLAPAAARGPHPPGYPAGPEHLALVAPVLASAMNWGRWALPRAGLEIHWSPVGKEPWESTDSDPGLVEELVRQAEAAQLEFLGWRGTSNPA